MYYVIAWNTWVKVRDTVKKVQNSKDLQVSAFIVGFLACFLVQYVRHLIK